MASTDIRQFYFYFKYLWSPADFTNLQLWLEETTAGIAEGAFGAAVLSGLSVTPAGGMNVSVAGGIAVGDEGQLQVIPTTPLLFTAPSAQPRKDLIVLRPTFVNMTVIPQPDNPSNPVPLHQKLTTTLLIIQGTEAASPVFPAKQDGDTIIMGVGLIPGQTSIALTDLDRSPINLARKRVHPYALKKGSYNVQATDDHLDFDVSASASIALLPTAAAAAGQDLTLVKIDASANTLSVSGQNPISGQSQIVLDTQWQSITVRSTGLEWRVL